MQIKTVAIYLRISRDKGENTDTLQNHRTRLIRLCNEQGYNNYTFYEEIVSGQANMKDRDELNRLLSDLEQYDGVVCMDTDRLSRDLEYSIHLWKRFESAGIPIITPSRIYTENDFMIFAVESVMAHQEYRQITKRMMQNKLERVRRGEWIQGKCPLGYVRNLDKKLVISEPEAQIVRTIYNYAIEGYGLPNIAKRLGYRTAKGKPFTMPTIRNILKNPVYKGTIVYNVMDKKGNITETISCKNAHEPLITSEQWNAVQLALQGRYSGNYETRNRNKGRILSILHSLVYCGNCGLKLGFRTDYKYKQNVYLRECKCGAKGVPEHRLVDTFLSEFEFLKRFYREEWQKVLNSPNLTSKDSLLQQVGEMEKTVEKLKSRIKNFKIMRADGELTKADYEEMKTETEKELNTTNDAIDDLKEQLQSLDKESITSQYEAKMERIDRFIYLYNKEASHEDIAECNRILKLLINKARYIRGDSESVINSPLEQYEANQGIQQDFVQLLIEPK